MYIGIGPEKDTVIKEEQAFDYALERSLHGTPEDHIRDTDLTYMIIE